MQGNFAEQVTAQCGHQQTDYQAAQPMQVRSERNGTERAFQPPQEASNGNTKACTNKPGYSVTLGHADERPCPTKDTE
jgi:hypothetical protein